MNVLKKVKNLFTSDGLYFLAFYFMRFTRLERLVPDEPFLKLKFRCYMRQKLHLDPPVTFNEKLQWLKLHDHNPLYTTLVDKVEVKKYVANIIGEEYIIPTLGVWDSVDDIDFDALPNQFVLKCNHDSGGIVICKDKSKLDITAAKKKLRKALRSDDAFYGGREWPYKNVKKRILAEKYLTENSRIDIDDYKVHCFDGIPQFILVCKDRFTEAGLSEDFFSLKWTHLDLKRPAVRQSDKQIDKPKAFTQMIELAEKLSEKISFVRTDFYDVGGKLFFGELTFYPATGMSPFLPTEWDEKLGNLITLPDEHEWGGVIYDCCQFALWIHPTSEDELKDYKFFCFDGKVKALFIASDRQNKNEETKFDFFDANFNHLNLRHGHPNAERPLEKPLVFEEMKRVAETLSKGFRHLRVDLYEVNNKIYFGELTLFHHTGMVQFEPPAWDAIFGEWLRLPFQIEN